MSRLLAPLFLCVLATSASAAAPPPARSPIRETLDVRYFPGKDRQLLDIFAPSGGTGKRYPVVIFVHGGTWMYGDKNFFGYYRGVGRFLARNGFVAVMINYRLSPAVKHPEHAKDVARAFAWACKHVDRYGGDPERIVLAGHSAGAHLVSLVATDESYLKDPALKLGDRERAALRGVVAVCGVYRIPPPAEFQKMASVIVAGLVRRNVPNRWAGLVAPWLLKAGTELNPFSLVFGTDRDVQAKASPLSHVHKGLPPFLLLNAEHDVPGLVAMADAFAAALRRAGNQVEMKRIDGCTHRGIVLQLHGDRAGDNPGEAGKTLLDFIRRHTLKRRMKDEG